MNKSTLLSIDWGLMTPVLILVCFSLATLFSLNTAFFRSQFIFLIISFVAYLFFSQTNFKTYQFYPVHIYVVSFVFLLIILFLGIESRGAVRWLDIFGFRIQFSEIIKPFLSLSLASYLASRSATFKTFFVSLIFTFPILFLVYRQPDLGNALIFAYTVMFTFFVYGFPLVWFLGGLLIMAGLFPFFWNFLREYQKQRLLTFLYPSNDPLGTSYNAMQSVIAVGSGMFFGKGIGEGTQSGLRFLPERHTDFIFATISEKFGFIAGLIIIITFGFLLYKIFLIFLQSDNLFHKLFCTLSFFFILVPLFINIGMNIGIVPITGVTLPFMSYGGSSLLSNFIFLGLIASLKKDQRSKTILEIR